MAVSAVAAAKRALRRQGFETLAAITPEDRAQQSAMRMRRLSCHRSCWW